MRYDAVTIGNAIRRLRRERSLSQEVLSGLACIARSHLAMIETGAKAANVETLAKIADALGLPLSAFFLQVEQEGNARSTNA